MDFAELWLEVSVYFPFQKMDSHKKTSRVSRLQSAAAFAGLCAAAIGLLGLLGWLLDQPRLTSFVDGFTTMKPNAAVAFVLGGVSLFLVTRESSVWAKRLSLVGAAVLTFVALATLGQFLFGWDLHIDQLLFRMKGKDALAIYPGRMAGATAIQFLVMGIALILLNDRRRPAAAQVSALIILLLSLFALAGYLYNVVPLYTFGAEVSVALPTALSFIMLGLGVICARPGEGLMAVVAGESAGSVMARRLIPAAVVFPLMLGWLCLQGQHAGLYDMPMGLALFALSNVIVFLSLIFWSSRALDSTDSERAAKADALRETQSRLRSILSAGSIGTWTWDLASGDVMADEFTARAFSMDPVAAEKGINVDLWVSRIHPTDQTFVQAALAEAIDTCGPYDIQYRVIGDDGSSHWLQARGRVEAENGKARHFHGAVMDITDHKLATCEVHAAKQRLELTLVELQKRNEDLALMTQQLWQASKLATMGELAASIAHELNNPLATMALRAELLGQQLPADDSKRSGVKIISNEVDRMAKLVGNLLEFSRRGHSQIASLDTREELKNTVDLIHYHLRSRGIEIVVDFPTYLPNIQADRQQLRQVFLNLLTNAGDSMPNGGTLTLRASCAESPVGDSSVTIEVIDTGMGIAPDDLKKVWEPFFTTKSEDKGTGLGLPICRRTVEEHRGTIKIESELDRGTVIKINLPTTSPLLIEA